MANLRQTRRRLLVVLIVLLAVDVAAAAVLLSPLLTSGAAHEQQFDQLRRQVQAKMRSVVPPDQVQNRVNEARQQIAAFNRERFASGAAALSTELGRLASSSGVHITNAHYEELDSDLPGLRRVRIDATILGDYLQDVKFINSAERDRTFFIIDNVSLGEAQGGTVRLGVTLETYLKGGAE